jgi:ATP-dependent Clp protease protease subunit
MKKLSKIVLGLLVVATIVLIPKVSVSAPNDTKTETVVLSENNLLVLNTEVNGESTAAIIAKAKELDAKLSKKEYLGKKAPLYLFLNTPGGSIQSGLEMIEALKGIGRQTNTVVLFAASMGWQICQALDDRLILKNGVLMSHRAAGEMQGSFGGTRPSQMDSRYELWLDRVKELDEQTVSRTNGKQTYDSYTKEYANEMWLTGTKSVQEGYADKVVLVKCDTTLAGVTTNHASILGFDISYDLDKCPINTAPMNIHVGSLDGKTVTAELTNKIQSEFLSTFENKQKQVIPLSF